MEEIPIVPKPKVLPNLDAVRIIRELFQNEIKAVVPSKKLSQNILTSLQNEKDSRKDRDDELFENQLNKKEINIEFTENVQEAHKNHQIKLNDIKEAEKQVFEVRAQFLKSQINFLEDIRIKNLLKLNRNPLLKTYDTNYVKNYQLFKGVPLDYKLYSDFRVRSLKGSNKATETSDNVIVKFIEKTSLYPHDCKEPTNKETIPEKFKRKIKKPRPKNKRTAGKKVEVLRAEPKMVFFTDFKLGNIYAAKIKIQSLYTKRLKFQIKPMCVDGPFRVMLNENSSTAVSPGLNFVLIVEFCPKSLDNAAEDVIIETEDGNRLLIPLIAYLEPPVLKTHKEVDEYTKVTSERISSSYIECGLCFTGDIKVIKVRFYCCRGSGEYFIMSSENWSKSHVNALTVENLLEIPPFRIYPVYFKVEKDEVIDLFVEFMPKNSGTHVENIIIACDNGQNRSLDILGDAVGWHSYYFSFQDSLIKEIPAEKDDDVKVKHYLNFGGTTPNGKVEKLFCVSNNSNMAFEFQWKIRETTIVSGQEKYLKLLNNEVKIDPESGTFEPNSVWEFLVTIEFNNAEIGNYRMVLSLYVLNLPYQCIEEDNTIIQPTGFVRNLYSQSLYGEEDGSALSPELASLQGTYESLQESIKSYVECQSKAHAVQKQDFCKTICITSPGLCAKPLKKSKTLFNIGEDEGLACVCRMKSVEPESKPESCVSNTRDDKLNETSLVKNEVIWDFVDILVNELELWVEVVPSKVTLQPSVLDLNTSVNVNDVPVLKKLKIINHNTSPITCSWSSSPDKNFKKLNNKKSFTQFSLLFDQKKENKIEKSMDSFDSTNNLKSINKFKQNGEEIKTCVINSQREKQKESSAMFKILVKPDAMFTVPGLSEYTCEIEISALQVGKIRKTLYLNVAEGKLKLELLILGTATLKSFVATPDILDFGMLKQGSRFTNYFSITNENSNSYSWKINEYIFDFQEEQFLYEFSSKNLSNTKNTDKVIKKTNCTKEPYCLDARVSGIKCSLLEIEKSSSSTKQYILVLGNVKIPRLSLSSPRFANAILALPGVIFVGKKVSTKVYLTNVGNVGTLVTWGYPFGCHSRRLSVKIFPRSFRIEREKKIEVNIDLTALEEGIVSHCYIPCFFCRSAEPLILSVIAIAKNVHVTFEILDNPAQTYDDKTKYNLCNTVLRIPWPSNMYNPTLGLMYINENDILNMKCHCQGVEEEASRVFDEPKQDAIPESVISEKSLQSSIIEMSDETSQKSRNSLEKSAKVAPDEYLQSLSNISAMDMMNRKSDEYSLTEYTNLDSSSGSYQTKKFHIEFLNIPYQTPVLKQFAIRNESAISTSFRINVMHYGASNNHSDKRFEIIKDRVFGFSNNDFQYKLEKNQPLLIVAQPSEGELKPFDAVCIDVYCYGNTWGEYRDVLICQVKGVEAYYLKLMIQIVGHPIFFPVFKTRKAEKPTIRFQPLTCTDHPTSKQIKVANRSSIPLNVTWMIFLTKPLLQEDEEEEKEDKYNLCVTSTVNFDSNHSGIESLQSSKNYIPKNASESSSKFLNMLDMKDLNQTSDSFKSFTKIEQSSSSSFVRKEKKQANGNEKKTSMVFSNEEIKTNIQQLGKLDTNIFQIEPKEMFFEPFQQKQITVTFNPTFYKPGSFPQEFKAVLASCVKLKPEDENSSELYYRPCGINFVSELLDLNGLIELPLVSFAVSRGDLKFRVDANDILKSNLKTVTILRKYLIKNTNENSLHIKIEILPGLLFKVNIINSLEKFYRKYNPDKHELQIESGHTVEMELQCSVTYKDVIYAFEQLKLNRKKEYCIRSFEEMKTTLNDNDEEQPMEKEPWQYFDTSFLKTPHNNRNLDHKDSFEININRMSFKSDNSFCWNNYKKMHCAEEDEELEGEYLALPKPEEKLCKPKFSEHVIVLHEEINFVQLGLLTQSLTAELHISFPAIRISPNCLDFGNVYLNETAVQYCSVINLTEFSTDFKVIPTSKASEFVVSPLTGSLPPANYKSDIGKTITIEFKPMQPGYFKELFHIYCNLDLEFDFFELFVSGFGTWDEKYKYIKFETYTKLDKLSTSFQK